MYYLRSTYALGIRKAASALLICALGVAMAGCNPKTLDPSQIGRFRPTPAVNVILNSLGVAEEAPVAWENAQEPQPSDVVAVRADYMLRAGDTVRVSIFELYQEGMLLTNDYIVSETGQISIPDVGRLPVAGLTERQLEDEVKRILSTGMLRNPSVTVTLLDSQQRTFSILGNAVAHPSRYMIPRYDFRLADALATAQVQMQFNVSSIYVSRRGETMADAAGLRNGRPAPELDLLESGPPTKREGNDLRTREQGRGRPPSSVLRPPSSGIPQPSEPAQKYESEREMLDLLTPQARSAWPQSSKVIGTPPRGIGPADITASVLPETYRAPARQRPGTSATAGVPEVQSLIEFGTPQPPEQPLPQAKPRERTEWVFQNGKWVQVVITENGGRTVEAPQPNERPLTAGTGPADQTEWTFRDGRWVSVPKGSQQAVKPQAKPQTVAMTPPARNGNLSGEAEGQQAVQGRVIRIPTDKLLAGDSRYNIIIKPGDTIHVPVDIIGEFYIMGNVNRSGYIDLTGRPMTLKMAIAAAGGLGPLAVPKNVDVTRRIGTAREEIVTVNLDKIASGEQPDFFIKPNDLINVGTDVTARWRAVLRNAFRATYGFGFVYDRNFADIDYGTGLPWFRNF